MSDGARVMTEELARSSTAVVEAPADEVEAPELAEAGAGAGGHEGVHLPPTSIWPITLAFSIALTASGLVTNFLVSIPGFLMFVWALRGWIQELLHEPH